MNAATRLRVNPSCRSQVRLCATWSSVVPLGNDWACRSCVSDFGGRRP